MLVLKQPLHLAYINVFHFMSSIIFPPSRKVTLLLSIIQKSGARGQLTLLKVAGHAAAAVSHHLLENKSQSGVDNLRGANKLQVLSIRHLLGRCQAGHHLSDSTRTHTHSTHNNGAFQTLNLRKKNAFTLGTGDDLQAQSIDKRRGSEKRKNRNRCQGSDKGK